MESIDEDSFKQTPEFHKAYEGVKRALCYAAYELRVEDGERIERVSCIEDIPEILQDLSEIEKKVLVDTLAEDLPRDVGLGMNYFDFAKLYLRLARFSKIFEITLHGTDWRELLEASLEDFEVVLKNPEYYGKNPEMIRGYMGRIRDEFGETQ